VVRAVVVWDALVAATVVDAHVRVRLPIVVVTVTAPAMVPSAAVAMVIAGVPEVVMVIAAAMAVVMVGSAVRWVLEQMVLIVAPVVPVVPVGRVALDSVPRSAAGKARQDYRF
jgi:hypothetical protein